MTASRSGDLKHCQKHFVINLRDSSDELVGLFLAVEVAERTCVVYWRMHPVLRYNCGFVVLTKHLAMIFLVPAIDMIEYALLYNKMMAYEEQNAFGM